MMLPDVLLSRVFESLLKFLKPLHICHKNRSAAQFYGYGHHHVSGGDGADVRRRDVTGDFLPFSTGIPNQFNRMVNLFFLCTDHQG